VEDRRGGAKKNHEGEMESQAEQTRLSEIINNQNGKRSTSGENGNEKCLGNEQESNPICKIEVGGMITRGMRTYTVGAYFTSWISKSTQ